MIVIFKLQWVIVDSFLFLPIYLDRSINPYLIKYWFLSEMSGIHYHYYLPYLHADFWPHLCCCYQVYGTRTIYLMHEVRDISTSSYVLRSTRFHWVQVHIPDYFYQIHELYIKWRDGSMIELSFLFIYVQFVVRQFLSVCNETQNVAYFWLSDFIAPFLFSLKSTLLVQHPMNDFRNLITSTHFVLILSKTRTLTYNLCSSFIGFPTYSAKCDIPSLTTCFLMLFQLIVGVSDVIIILSFSLLLSRIMLLT